MYLLAPVQGASAIMGLWIFKMDTSGWIVSLCDDSTPHVLAHFSRLNDTMTRKRKKKKKLYKCFHTLQQLQLQKNKKIK
jgi:hypothetical protein